MARGDGGGDMNKTWNNKAWFMVMPVLALVAFNALIPLMTVVNYSVQDIFGPGNAYYVGTEWFRDTIRDPELQAPEHQRLRDHFERYYARRKLGFARVG